MYKLYGTLRKLQNFNIKLILKHIEIAFVLSCGVQHRKKIMFKLITLVLWVHDICVVFYDGFFAYL